MFWVCGSSHSKVITFLPESCMKKGKWRSAICNYKQLDKNLCVSFTKLKQTTKGSLCYSESIYVQYRQYKSIYYRNCGSSLRASTLRNYVYNYSDLENRMSLACHSCKAIVMRLKIFSWTTEWVDVYYKHICGNILTLWNHLFMVNMQDSEIHADWK